MKSVIITTVTGCCSDCVREYPNVKLFYTVRKMFQTVRNVTHSDHVNVYTQFCRETTFVANLHTFKYKISWPKLTGV